MEAFNTDRAELNGNPAWTQLNVMHIAGYSRGPYMRMLQGFEQCPPGPPPPGMRDWLEFVEKVRQKTEEKCKGGHPKHIPADRYLLFSNRDPSGAEDEANVLKPVYMVLAYWEGGQLWFASPAVSGLHCYGERMGWTRHSFIDLSNSESSKRTN